MCQHKCIRFFSLVVCLLTISNFAIGKSSNPYLGNNNTHNDQIFDSLAQTKQLIDDSLVAFQDIRLRAPHPTFKQLMHRAKGVIIIPSYYSGGFLLGAGHGQGVFLAKTKNGEWSYPAFYTITSASVGFQIGGQSTKMLLIILTNKGLRSILNNSFTLGGTAGLSVWGNGSAVGGSTTTNTGADVVMFSVTNKGIFAGLTISGASLIPNTKYNHVFYANKADVNSIILQGKYGNPASNALRHALEIYSVLNINNHRTI